MEEGRDEYIDTFVRKLYFFRVRISAVCFMFKNMLIFNLYGYSYR